jgi:molecular chaperone DnaJ
MTGEGEAGTKGGGPGDLYIFISVKPHASFRRQGDDVLSEVKIGLAQAALGTTVIVKTLDGDVELKIPEGTQTETVFRLRGKGITHLRGHGRGDQHVRVKVTVPTKLSKEQRDALLRYAVASGEEVAGDKGILGKVKDALGK